MSTRTKQHGGRSTKARDRAGLAADPVARRQRARLQAAMVESVYLRGYDATTLGELAKLAKVSKSTFYEHFESKEDCFLSTCDAIVALTRDSIGQAYRSQEGFRDRLQAAGEAFAEILIEQPAPSSLVVVESFALGAAGLPLREQAAAVFERMIRQSFDEAPERGEVSDLTIRAIVAGMRRVVYHRLQARNAEELRDHVEVLLDWALSYQRPGGAGSLPGAALAAATKGAPGERPAADRLALGWEEPPASPRSRADLSQRERIVRAAAQVAAKDGYGAMSIPAITAAAGVSNQTFYEHFNGKLDACLAASDELGARALETATMAFQEQRGEWPAKIASGMRALLEYISRNRLFAHLAFVEMAVAGQTAQVRQGAVVMESFSTFLEGEALPPGVTRLPAVVVEAIAGGIWGAIQVEIAHGRAKTLPELAPGLAFIALAPFAAPASP